MAIYKVKLPSGQVVPIEGDQPPTKAQVRSYLQTQEAKKSPDPILTALGSWKGLMTPDAWKELTSSSGDAETAKRFKDSLQYGKEEAIGFLQGLNPLNLYHLAKTIYNDPKSLPAGAEQMVADVINLNPRAVGGALSVPVAGKLTNMAGTALVDNPKIASAMNTVGGTAIGAIGAKEMGISPYIGGFAGRNLLKDSKMPLYLGRTLQIATGGAPAKATGAIDETAGLSASDLAGLKEAEALGPAARAQYLQALKRSEPPVAGKLTPVAAPGDPSAPISDPRQQSVGGPGTRDRLSPQTPPTAPPSGFDTVAQKQGMGQLPPEGSLRVAGGPRATDEWAAIQGNARKALASRISKQVLAEDAPKWNADPAGWKAETIKRLNAMSNADVDQANIDEAIQARKAKGPMAVPGGVPEGAKPVPSDLTGTESRRIVLLPEEIAAEANKTQALMPGAKAAGLGSANWTSKGTALETLTNGPLKDLDPATKEALLKAIGANPMVKAVTESSDDFK